MNGQQAAWVDHFRELKAALRPGFDNNIRLFSSVLFSKERTREELAPAVEMLEPCYAGRQLIHSVAIPLKNGATLDFLYFSPDIRGLKLLNTTLADIE